MVSSLFPNSLRTSTHSIYEQRPNPIEEGQMSWHEKPYRACFENEHSLLII